MEEQPGAKANILKLEGVTQVYKSGEKDLTVLQSVDLEVATGSSLAIVGPSGSGKTTLLGLCAGLDQPATGTIELAGHRLDMLDEEGRAAVRNTKVGFVFQNFQLIPTLTALENVLIPLELRGIRNAHKKAMHWLEEVGLGARASHYPVQLSGGEQQRVALARACVGEPQILFADEPTGNLDAETGAHVEEMLFNSHQRTGNTLILVTHDHQLAAKTDRIVRIRGGKIIGDTE